jgi:hypothetical protein
MKGPQIWHSLPSCKGAVGVNMAPNMLRKVCCQELLSFCLIRGAWRSSQPRNFRCRRLICTARGWLRRMQSSYAFG